MTAPTPRCRWCGKLEPVCPDQWGHERLHAQSETHWREVAERRMVSAILTPDSPDAEVPR